MTVAPELVLIAAVARNGAIGRANGLIFRESVDQRHFRDATMGHPVIMGRRTWDSLPPRFRPLPGRRNIVLSRDPGWHAAGAELAGGLDEALALAPGASRAFVAGGAQVYALALPQARTLMLTEIDADLEGDSFFPCWDRTRYTEAARETRHTADGLRYDFVTYRRHAGEAAP